MSLSQGYFLTNKGKQFDPEIVDKFIEILDNDQLELIYGEGQS